jgi:hypothetical protein
MANALSRMSFTSSNGGPRRAGGERCKTSKAQIQPGGNRKTLALRPYFVTVPQGTETTKAAKAMSRKELTKAVAYFRTSSATNVGPDKDSLKRQRAAVVTFAKSAGYEIAEEF